MSTSQRRRRHFSENFKKEKVKEIEIGLSRVSEICKQYDYYVVVGSVKEIERAIKWATYGETLGFTTCITHSHTNYDMVYVKGGDDLKSTLAIMENVRERFTPRAWVYIRRK